MSKWNRCEFNVKSKWHRSEGDSLAEPMARPSTINDPGKFAHLGRSMPWNLWDLKSLWYILEDQTLESLRSWVWKVRLGKSQFVIAEILNYICICSHLVQAFGRHGAIDTNGPSTRMVVCGTKAYRTKKSRGILAKRGNKSYLHSWSNQMISTADLNRWTQQIISTVDSNRWSQQQISTDNQQIKS